MTVEIQGDRTKYEISVNAVDGDFRGFCKEIIGYISVGKTRNEAYINAENWVSQQFKKNKNPEQKLEPEKIPFDWDLYQEGGYKAVFRTKPHCDILCVYQTHNNDNHLHLIGLYRNLLDNKVDNGTWGMKGGYYYDKETMQSNDLMMVRKDKLDEHL